MPDTSRRGWLRGFARTAAALATVAAGGARAQLLGTAQPDPLAILAKAKEASGGAAWDALRTQHSKVSIGAGPVSGQAERWSEYATGRSAIAFAVGPVTGAAGFDAKGPWVQDAAGETRDETDPAARELAVNAAYRDRLAFWFPERAPARIVYKERAAADGATFHVIRVTPEGGRPFELWINAETSLVERLVEREATTVRTEEYMDMRNVAGVTVPFRVRAAREGQRDEVVTVDTMAFNEPLPPGRLVRPAPPPPDYAFPPGKAAVELPFELVDGHVFVRVTLDDRRVRMLLDSGGNNVLLPSVALATGAKMEGGTGPGELGVARVARVGLGGLVLANQSFATIDLAAFLRRVEGTDDIGGVLGAELFRRVVVQLDYARSRLTLHDPASYRYTGTGTTLPIVPPGKTPRVAGSVDGVAGVFRVDTGNRGSLTLAQGFAAANGIADRHRGIEAVHGAGASGPLRGTVARTTSLTLGNLDIAGPVTAIVASDSGALADPDIAGSIGNGILRRFDAVFDLPHGRLHLARNASFAAPDVYDRAGMWVERGERGFEVVDVVAGGPAQSAGLVPGDVIVAVDGVRAAATSLASLRGLLRGPAGRKVRLAVDGGAVKVVTLRDLF